MPVLSNQKPDAVSTLREHIVTEGHATEGDMERISAELEARIDRAIEFARASPVPDPAGVEDYVYPERLPT